MPGGIDAHAVEDDYLEVLHPGQLPADLVKADLLGDFAGEDNLGVGPGLAGASVLFIEGGDEALGRVRPPRRAYKRGGSGGLGDA